MSINGKLYIFDLFLCKPLEIALKVAYDRENFLPKESMEIFFPYLKQLTTSA